MSSRKQKCALCNKHNAKYIYEDEGEYYHKPICKQCLKKIFLEKEGRWEEYQQHCTKSNSNILLFSLFVLLFSIIIYCKTFSDFNSIIVVFKDESKIIYIVLFSTVNYVAGLLMGQITQNQKWWIKLIINILFTLEFTLVGCVVTIRQDIIWHPLENPLVYLTPTLLCLHILIFILNKIKKLDASKLTIASSVIFIVSCALCVWSVIVMGY